MKDINCRGCGWIGSNNDLIIKNEIGVCPVCEEEEHLFFDEELT